MTTSETGSAATSMIAPRPAPSPGTPSPAAPADPAWAFPRRPRGRAAGGWAAWLGIVGGGRGRGGGGARGGRGGGGGGGGDRGDLGRAGAEQPLGRRADEARPHRHPPRESAAGGRHPARQHRRHLLVGAVLQQPREQQVPGLEQGEILLVVDLPRRQQPRGLGVEQGGGQQQERPALVRV